MFPLLRFVPMALLLGALAAPVSVAHAQTAPSCQFVLGFKTLHDLDGSDVGDCTDNQGFAPNGDAQQHTTKGLMAWRKADNWTAFTNGYTTWINGPSGLVSRLNTDRFPWEAPAPSAGTSTTPAPSAATSTTPPPSAGNAASPAIGAAGQSAANPAPSPAGQPAAGPAPCVTSVTGTVQHDLGPFYLLNVHATDAKGAGIPGLQGTFTVDYEDGYWPLYDVTDASGNGWNDWVVTAPSSPVTATVTMVGGGCSASTKITFPLSS